jgi:uncharacterized membrane protein YfcA
MAYATVGQGGATGYIAIMGLVGLHPENTDDDANPPPLAASVLAGAVIGFVAGITGIGGGILLAPLTLARKWASTSVAHFADRELASLGA